MIRIKLVRMRNRTESMVFFFRVIGDKRVGTRYRDKIERKLRGKY